MLAIGLIFGQLNFFRVEPIVDFFSEWIATLGLLLALTLGIRMVPGRAQVSLSLIFAPLVLLAMVGARWLFADPAYPSESALWASYVVVFMLAAVLGQALQHGTARDAIVESLASIFLLIALINFGLQALQVFNLDHLLGAYIVKLYAGLECRPFGNIAQANHATIAAWCGIGAALYLFAKGRIARIPLAMILAALLLSSAVTSSRVAWLALAVVAVLLLAFRTSVFSSSRAAPILAVSLIGGFIAAAFLAELLQQQFSPACSDSALSRTFESDGGSSSIRRELWRQAIMVFASSPLFGVGPNGFMAAVYQLESFGVHQPLDFYPHSTPLQVFVEFGILGGGLVLATVLLWMYKTFSHRHVLRAEDFLLLAWLGCVGAHASVEFPLHYTHWLIPFGLWLGLLIRPDWTRGVVLPVRAIFVTIAGLLIVASAFLLRDFTRLDRLVYLVGLQTSVGTNDELTERTRLTDEGVIVFRFHADHAKSLLLDSRTADIPYLQAHFDRLLSRGPSPESIYRRILVAVRMADMEAARFHLRRLYMFFPSRAQEISAFMRRVIADKPELAALGPLIDEELPKAPRARW
jgi:O-antigen ligase